MPLYPPNCLISDCWSSVGNVTFFHIDGKCYWKSKARPVFPGTAAQLRTLDVHRRALEAWRGVPEDVKEIWGRYALEVPSHRPPFDSHNHISGYNLFVSAYHGFARLGRECVPEPRQFVAYPPFAVEVVSAVVEDGDMGIVCRLQISNHSNPERFRLLAKVQLVEPGRSYHSGKMRTYLAEEVGAEADGCGDVNGGRLVRFCVPGYVEVFGLQLREYTVHFRLVLIDEVTGYRSRYLKHKSKLIL